MKINIDELKNQRKVGIFLSDNIFVSLKCDGDTLDIETSLIDEQKIKKEEKNSTPESLVSKIYEQDSTRRGITDKFQTILDKAKTFDKMLYVIRETEQSMGQKHLDKSEDMFDALDNCYVNLKSKVSNSMPKKEIEKALDNE